MFEKSMWIGRGIEVTKDEEHSKSVLLRKAFSLQKPVTKAVLNVCGLGLGVYTVNGKRVTDEVLTTPYTSYDKRVIYRSFDVTELLQTGENALGVHLGNGFYFNSMPRWHENTAVYRHEVKLLAQLTVTYADGSEDVLVSDRSWKYKLGPCVYNQMRQGEKYDARLESAGFDLPGYDDSDWQNVKHVMEPGGILEPMNMPPIRVIRTLQAKRIEEDLYDFGENISGRACITVTGKPGQEITLTYDELKVKDEVCVEEDETLAEIRNRAGVETARNNAAYCYLDNMPLKHQTVFICSGAEKEQFAPEFTYYGFRYVRVTNAPKDFKIVAQVIHTDLPVVGHFECCDEMLNKIHKASVRATLSNCVGNPTDCPHREQNAWTGDAHVACDQSLMNFDMLAFYRKWLRDFKDAQRPNGQLPSVIPYSGCGWGFRFYSGPAWSGALIQIPWKTYLATGDTEIIREMFPNMRRYLYLLERTSEDYIYDFGYGDWCPPWDAPQCPKNVLHTALFYDMAVNVGKMAKLIGEDSTEFEEMAEKIRTAWRARFLNDESLQEYQSYFGCAVYYNLLTEEEKPVFAKKLAELTRKMDYHFNCGILGIKYIFTVLSEYGYAEDIYKCLVNPEYPGYGYWIASGMTTLPETWEMGRSLNHQMFSEVDNWFYRYLGGIRLEEDGLKIAPCLLSQVPQFTASHRDICVKREGSTLTVTVPREAQITVGGRTRSVCAGTYTYEV